jgi:hypothetical protein
MSIIKHSLNAVKTLVLGETLLPEEFTIGLAEPQTEISVWLHGLEAPLDVTHRHCTACSAPFTLCVAFDEGRRPAEKDLRRLSLKYCTRDPQQQVLGEIGLTWKTTLPVTGAEMFLFEARSSANYCMPKRHLGAHNLLHAYSHWRSNDSFEIKMSLLEKRAAIVTFIRPHLVSLVSLTGDAGGNIFPMNLMGGLGNGRLGFGLRDSRLASHLVEGARRIALSSVPLPQAPVAYQLAANHRKASIDWDQLPFATRMSSTFKIPVPVFALRVRELEVEKIHKIGSHTLFVAKIVSDESLGGDPALHVIHGFYQAWRLRGRSAALAASVAEDAFNKRGVGAS